MLGVPSDSHDARPTRRPSSQNSDVAFAPRSSKWVIFSWAEDGI
jgi:hypothetical protein